MSTIIGVLSLLSAILVVPSFSYILIRHPKQVVIPGTAALRSTLCIRHQVEGRSWRTVDLSCYRGATKPHEAIYLRSLALSSTTNEHNLELADSPSSSHERLSVSQPVPPILDVNDESGKKKYQRLMSWLSEQGAIFSNKLELRQSIHGDGYGVFVIEPVEPGEALAYLPRAICVTLNDALSDPDCGAQWKNLVDKAGPGGHTVVLAGFLARERLLSMRSTASVSTPGTTSSGKSDAKESENYQTTSSSRKDWGPYLETLPWERGVNGQEHVLYWTDEDVETYLKGSFAYGEAIELRKEVKLAIQVLNRIVGPSLLAARQQQGNESKTLEGTSPTTSSSGWTWPWEKNKEPAPLAMVEGLPQAVTGAFVSILTRAFQDGPDSDEEKMVPFLDLLQHSEEPNVSHLMNQTDQGGSVQVSAKKALEPGEELLNQYRSELEENMPYHRFFTRFGFVPGLSLRSIVPSEVDQIAEKEEEPLSIRDLLLDKSSIFFPQEREV